MATPTIHTAPASSIGKVILGRTLPSLLDEAADAYPNPKAFNQPKPGGGWTTMSNGDFRTGADEIAVGLLESGLERGAHAAMFMDSDLHFALVDFGTLIAGILNVPLYTSGTTGQPKGVMLTHENISSNVFAAYTGIRDLGHQDEVALTFLPLTHIYARMLSFADVAWGHQTFYSNPDLLVGHLAEVRPTIFATVPRVLEKVYDKVTLGVQQSEGAKKAIGSWAMGLATDFDMANPPGGLGALKQTLADKLVYSKLRERLGLTRVRVVSVGGAALRPDLSNSFAAWGIPTLQGYGLTETSPVITNSTPDANLAGTTGQPIAGVEVMIAADGEILTRGPHVMKGYYKEPEKTAEAISPDGWFHTGDIGEFTSGGFLKITDRKKSLFKLSTGKYVIPQPIENALTENALIEQAMVVGNSEKYATALLFPNADALAQWGKAHGVSGDATEMVKNPTVLAEFERIATAANDGIDHWMQIKRFRLCPETMTLENGLLTPKMSVKRSDVTKRYADDIQAMYAAQVRETGHNAVAVV